LQRRFNSEGYANVETVNAGASGDTSAGGLRRVGQTLGPDVRILVIAIGNNDALRGLTLAQTHDNLNGIIEAALGKGVGVLLCGLEAPTNYGEDYRQTFRDLFVNLLREHSGKISFMPFLLEGVAGNPALNQSDGIHPTADGARIIADAMYPKLRAMVDQLGGG
jgi:acyl-CoA thioesterase-1